jgi:hypothetical protein
VAQRFFDPRQLESKMPAKERRRKTRRHGEA